MTQAAYKQGFNDAQIESLEERDKVRDSQIQTIRNDIWKLRIGFLGLAIVNVVAIASTSGVTNVILKMIGV